ncbi:general secretion pathway protein L [Sinorhizobium terangae]|uniref:General secretion pathway protein GspL n=1 Tax=Sinorhizobium terangae TaxID=110322 RepID=A0A6N7L9W9_SINTE|nr:PilN domain-containing protein [Sinorhizobium terangae]MBB4187344.1 general secretion pathway protein L [Sinorhizobium terangae]MQX14643.1 general secretion pathway protein GspL [Sinorhizobium terangae]
MTFRELAPSLHAFTLGLKDFLIWWRSELRHALPPFLASRMRARTPAVTVLSVAREGCRLGDDPDLIPLADLGERLRALQAGGAMRTAGIRVHLAPDRCLRRVVSPRRLPISALRKAAELEVETQTPFDKSDVQILVPAHLGAASAYYLVRNGILAEMQHQLRTANLQVRELSTAGKNGALDPLVISGTPLRVARRFKAQKALVAGMAAVTVALLVLSWDQLHSKASAANGHLDGEITRAEVEARKARRAYDAYVARISQVEALKSQSLAGPRATVMWEELSRIVPDASYLTNLTVKDDRVEISGFSKASSELIPLIEASDLFESAQFVSPVVKVPGFEGDRFTISFSQGGAKR